MAKSSTTNTDADADKAAAEQAAVDQPAAEATAAQADADKAAVDAAAVAQADADQAAAEAAAAAQAQSDLAEAAQALQAETLGVVLFAFSSAVTVGDMVQGDERRIKALVKGGDVDDHPDAIEAAQARGAKTVKV